MASIVPWFVIRVGSKYSTSGTDSTSAEKGGRVLTPSPLWNHNGGYFEYFNCGVSVI